jgi:hypothetical protein
MPIKFQCPHCKSAIVAQDAQAGMKKACPGCKKPLFIPLPTSGATKPMRPPAPPRLEPRPKTAAELEAEAAALFSDAPAQGPAAPAATIDFSCPQCDADLHLPLDLAGKKTSCPACTRIIAVPLPSKEENKDWRQKQQALPSLAKQPDEPAPEGAWGSAKAAGVSREALLEAKVITKRPKPRTMTQKYLLPVLGATLLIGSGVGAWVISNRREEGRELAALQEATTFATAAEAKQATVPAIRAALFLAAGDYHRLTGKADCGVRAREQYNNALNLLATASGQDSERTVSLMDLAVAQIELGGDESEVEQGLRLKWDEVHKSLRGILTAVPVGDTTRPPEGKLAVLRAIVRRLIARGQAERTVTLVRQVYGGSDADSCEAMAAAGLELLAAQDTERATRAATQARAPYDARPAAGGSPGRAAPRPPVRATVVALVDALGEKKKLEGNKAIGEEAQIFLGQVEGFARLGKWEKAREKARSDPVPLNRFRALAAIALVAAETGTGAVEALNEAADFLTSNALPREELNWLLLRLAEVGLEVGLGTDRLEKLIDAITDPYLYGRAQLLWVRAQVKQGTIPSEEAASAVIGRIEARFKARAVGTSVARLAVWQIIARASTRRDPNWANSILGWEQPRRAFASAGVALGLEDRDHGK